MKRTLGASLTPSKAISAYVPIAKRHIGLILLCLAFVVTSAILLHWYRYTLNPDATSYFTIAEKYAHLDFRHAINGYWSPLLSWLLVPAVWVHLNLIIAARLIDIITSCIILTVVYKFFVSRSVSLVTNLGICFFMALFLLRATVIDSITPDLLEAMFVILTGFSLSEFMRQPRLRLAIWIGVLGALMYFTKGFSFYLFVATIFLLAAWQFLRTKYSLREVLSVYAPIAITFVVLVLPFVAVISLKYHHPTISTAGSFNRNLYGPISQGNALPMLTYGPLPPPNATANSIWEDPSRITNLLPDYGWSPLSSSKNFKYFIESIVGRNINYVIADVSMSGALVSFGVLVMAVGSVASKKYRTEFVLFLLISGLMAAGYCLVNVEARYIYAVSLFALLAAGLAISMAEKSALIKRSQVLVGVILICGMSLLGTVQALVQNKDLTKPSYQTALQLGNYVPKGSNIVSDRFSPETCYLLDLHCYSALQTPAPSDQASYYQLLKSDHIQYFVSYDPISTGLAPFVNAHFSQPTVVSTPIGSVAIYKLI